MKTNKFMLAFALALALGTNVSFASEGGAASLPIYDFLLEPLAAEFSGPLPITIGIIGLAAAAIALFNGNGGDGTRRFLGIVFGVGAALAAPMAVSVITGSMIP